MRTLVSNLSSALTLHKPTSRWLRAAGILLLVSAAFHVVVLIVSGAQWAGPVGMRKPITFGLSVGLMLWTVGWVIDQLPSRPRLEAIVSGTLAVSSLAEVALITLQAWRGVPSHFNSSTALDGALFAGMGVTVMVLSLALAACTVWVFVAPPADPVVRLAARAGLVVMLVGLSIGGWMIGIGTAYYERTEHVPDPLRSGADGVPTFAHGMALHGIQLFVGAAILLGLLGLSVAAALRIVRLVISGYSLLVGWAIVQAVTGVAPLYLTWLGTGLFLLGLGILVVAGGLAVRSWRHVERSEISSTAPAAVPSAV